MKVNEAIARGYNFFVMAVLGILGGSVVTELSVEDAWLHRLDELLLIAIGIVAIGWYLAGRNRIQRSVVLWLLAFCALGAKLLGLVLEFTDTKDVGNDFGVGQFLLLFVIMATVAYVRTRPTAESSNG